MGDKDSWQQQLAFVSSYIIVFGFALLKLWPFTATFQTGQNINFWTANLPWQGVRTPLWVFWALTMALAVALSAVMLAVVHILCRGLWLAFFAQSGSDPVKVRVGSWLGRYCMFTYYSAFCLLIYLLLFIFVVVAVMLRAGFEQLLVTHLSVSVRAAGLMSVGLYVLVVSVLGIWAYFRIMRYLRRTDWNKILRILRELFPWLLPFATAGFLIGFMLPLTVQTCYAVGMTVAGQVFHRSRSDLIQVQVTLGGAASDVSLLRLRLGQPNGQPVSDLSVEDLGEGQYLATLRSEDLPIGRYHVVLEYPHSAFDFVFPFLHRRVTVQRWFLVVS